MATIPTSGIYDIGTMFVKVMRSHVKGKFEHMMLFTATSWDEETGAELPGQTLWLYSDGAIKLRDLLIKELSDGEKEEA